MSNDFPEFPALAFVRDVTRWAVPGGERLAWFLSEDDFSTCTDWELSHGQRLGMLVVDRGGRCWRVTAVRRIGVTGPFWERVWRFLNRQSLHRISLDMVEEDRLTFEQVKGRVCASITANPDDWRIDGVIARENGSPPEDQDVIDELQAAVHGAKTIPQMINALYPEELPDAE